MTPEELEAMQLAQAEAAAQEADEEKAYLDRMIMEGEQIQQKIAELSTQPATTKPKRRRKRKKRY